MRTPLQRKIAAACTAEPSEWLTQGLTDEEIQACIEEGIKQAEAIRKVSENEQKDLLQRI